MGLLEVVIQLFAKPLGFIGVIAAILGLYFGMIGNLLGWIFFAFGVLSAFISEKG